MRATFPPAVLLRPTSFCVFGLKICLRNRLTSRRPGFYTLRWRGVLRRLKQQSTRQRRIHWAQTCLS